MNSQKLTIALLSVICLATSCQKSGAPANSNLMSTGLSSEKVLSVAKSPALDGPQIVFVNTLSNYQLLLPDNFVAQSASWNFGDGTINVSGLKPTGHKYTQSGLYTLSVDLFDSNNVKYTLSQTINVIADSSQFTCVGQATLTSPSEANINSPITVTGFIPDCLKNDLTGFTFDYGDGLTGTTLSAEHSYTRSGSYQISFDINTIFQDDPSVPYLRLSRTVIVTDPNQGCPLLDATRTKYTDSFNQSALCGLNGNKTQTFKTKIVEQCKAVNQESLAWVEISRTNELQSESSCENQSCVLPDSSVLENGASKVFYSSENTTGLCSSISLSRTCNNGTLSGSDTFNTLVCHNGCGDFGPHGTLVTGVVTGEIKTPIACSFNETGFFNTYNQISDKQCVDGQIVISNVRQGTLKNADLCPTYHWNATDVWSTCSANCGGEQTRTFACLNSKNETVADTFCTSDKPTEKRLCDLNPAAVSRTEKTSVTEEGGSSVQCPKNQIGVITQSRVATTIKNYACVNHSVQMTDEHVEYSAWETQKYCRDYVAYRCSQDSLNNTQAVERYKWLLKCENQVPVIKEFLKQFSTVKGSNKYTIDAKARVLYPTFMQRIDGKEKVWIAPKVSTASCTVPATAYIAAVCVSSCATPEQQILVEAKEQKLKMQYKSFIDSLTEKTSYVGSLTTTSQLNSKNVKAMAVDQWVTEMVDTEHIILEFKMKSGRSLRLTKNHPVVASNGTVQLAETFKAGDYLVELGGKLDLIQSIQETKYFGKVYNLFVKSSEPLENIVITNGYLNGTAFYQNEGSGNINRVLLRNKLTKGLFN